MPYCAVMPDAVLISNALWIKLSESQAMRSNISGAASGDLILKRPFVVLHWCVRPQISVGLVELSRVLTELSFLGSLRGSYCSLS